MDATMIVDEARSEERNGRYAVVMRAASRLIIDPGEAVIVNITHPSGPLRLTIFTDHVDEGHEVAVPRELVIQANGAAPSLNAAIAHFYSTARPFGDILAFCGNATVGLLEPHIAWDDTAGRPEREFMEVYLKDERGLPLSGRRLKLTETRALLRLMTEMAGVNVPALVGVLARYGVALNNWYLGGETAAFTYLWFAVEALAKLVVTIEVRAEGGLDAVADKYEMPRNGSVSQRKLEAFMRRRWVFADDPLMHDIANFVAMGWNTRRYRWQRSTLRQLPSLQASSLSCGGRSFGSSIPSVRKPLACSRAIPLFPSTRSNAGSSGDGS